MLKQTFETIINPVASPLLFLGSLVTAVLKSNKFNKWTDEYLSATVENKLNLKNLDAIAVSKGPGSYTGLRVGVSSAKGYCYGLDIPLISIGTLDSLKNQVIEVINPSENCFIISMLDARRMEVYCGIWNQKSEQIQEIEAKILDESSFLEYISETKTYFIGTGNDKFNKIISL